MFVFFYRNFQINVSFFRFPNVQITVGTSNKRKMWVAINTMGIGWVTFFSRTSVTDNEELWLSLFSIPLLKIFGKSFGLVGWWGDSKLQLAGVGKLNRWVLELNFAGQIINFKSLSWIIYSFTEFFFSLFVHLHLFIYLPIYLFIDIFYIWMSFVGFTNCK